MSNVRHPRPVGYLDLWRWDSDTSSPGARTSSGALWPGIGFEGSVVCRERSSQSIPSNGRDRSKCHLRRKPNTHQATSCLCAAVGIEKAGGTLALFRVRLSSLNLPDFIHFRVPKLSSKAGITCAGLRYNVLGRHVNSAWGVQVFNAITNTTARVS